MAQQKTLRQKLFSAYMALDMKVVLREWIAECREKGICWVCRRRDCKGVTGETFKAHWSQAAPNPGAREWATLAIVKGRK